MAKGDPNNRGQAMRDSIRSQQRKNNYANNEFVKRELSVQEQAQCKAWSVTDADLWNQIEVYIEEGYKLTLKWDDYSNSYAAWMQPIDSEHDNWGYILSGRGSTPAKAVKQLFFKHTAVLDGQWGNGEQFVKGAIDD
jgi:hypothetical protein